MPQKSKSYFWEILLLLWEILEHREKNEDLYVTGGITCYYENIGILNQNSWLYISKTG